MAVWEYEIATDKIVTFQDFAACSGTPDGATPSLDRLWARYASGERDWVLAASAAASRGERFFSVDYQYLPPDSPARWLSMRAAIVYGSGGRSRPEW